MRVVFLIGTVAIAAVGTLIPETGSQSDLSAGQPTTRSIEVVETSQSDAAQPVVTLRIASPQRARTVRIESRTKDGDGARSWATVRSQEVSSGTETVTLADRTTSASRYRAVVDYQGSARAVTTAFKIDG